MRLLTTVAMTLAAIGVLSWTSTAQAQLTIGINAGNTFPYPGVKQPPRASLGFHPGHFRGRRAGNFGAAWWNYQLQNVNGMPRHEEPPYFAKFPPVYYNGIVRRPYGISPYAAPAGTMPVEMTVHPEPETVANPYYDATPAEAVTPSESAAPDDKAQDDSNKVTWQLNPYREVLADDR